MANKKSNNLLSFLSLSGLSIAEKVIAFVFQMVVAAILGTTIVTDCYYSSMELYNLIDSTILGGLVVAIINKYANISNDRGEEEAFGFLTNVNTCFTIIMLVISVLSIFFARPLSYMIAPGFEESGREGLIRCIRIMAIIPTITVIATICQGLLRQKKHFAIVNLRSLMISIFGIGAVIVLSNTDKTNTDILCIGYILSNVAFAVILYIQTLKYGKVGFCKPKLSDDMKSLIKITLPTIVSQGLLRLSLMLDQIVASTVGEGAITCLIYSQSLYHIVTTILVVNLGVILLTEFTNLCVEKQFDKIAEKLDGAISAITLILLPVSVLSMMYSNEIVSVIYERGAFDAAASKKVADLLLFYAAGFIPMMFANIYTQVLYGFGKMKTTMYCSIASLVINMVLNIVLAQIFDLKGIAIATSVASFVSAFLMKRAVRKVIPQYKHIYSFNYLKKVIPAIFVGTAGALLIKISVPGKLISFVTATAVMFVLFLTILLLLKEENLIYYKNKILRKK